MSKESYYPQAYKCSCSLITRHYVWASDLKKAKHTCECGNKLTSKHIYAPPAAVLTSIRTPTKNR